MGESGCYRYRNNQYEYRVRFQDEYGVSYQKSFCGKTKRICREKYNEYVRNTHKEVTPKKSLGAFAEEWIEAKKSSVSYRTWKNYNNYLHNYVLKFLNPKRQLATIKPLDIEKMMSHCTDMSDSAKKDILLTAKQLFDAAYRNDLIKKNPCYGIKVHKTDEIRELVVFTPEEIKVIEEHIPSSPIGAGIAIMLYTGLRTEEVCALHWEDVDMENRVIRVCRKIIIDEDNICKDVRSTKNGKVRYVPFPEQLYEVLCNLEVRKDVPYVIPYQEAKKTYKYKYEFYTPHVFFERYESFFKPLPIRYLSPHKLRHTYGTYLVRSGAPLPTVQNLLGHSSINTTRIYTNMDLTDQMTAVSKLKFSY